MKGKHLAMFVMLPLMPTRVTRPEKLFKAMSASVSFFFGVAFFLLSGFYCQTSKVQKLLGLYVLY